MLQTSPLGRRSKKGNSYPFIPSPVPAQVKWDNTRAGYVVTLDRKAFCTSCREISDVAELQFNFVADKPVYCDPANLPYQALTRGYFAEFSASPGQSLFYNVFAVNQSVCSLTTNDIINRPGKHYLFRLYRLEFDSGTFKKTQEPGGEVKVYIEYKKHFSAPRAER